MSQVHLTPEQVEALAKLPAFEGVMTLTQRFQPKLHIQPGDLVLRDYIYVTVAHGSEISAVYTIDTLGSTKRE